jgi:hypothetical protein
MRSETPQHSTAQHPKKTNSVYYRENCRRQRKILGEKTTSATRRNEQENEKKSPRKRTRKKTTRRRSQENEKNSPRRGEDDGLPKP